MESRPQHSETCSENDSCECDLSEDHESRNNSYSRDLDGEEAVSERTPLLRHMFLRAPSLPGRTHLTTIVVTMLLLSLISGIVIGTYLLIEQEEPLPVNVPFQLVARDEWDSTRQEHSVSLSDVPARRVLIVHTDTEECDGVDTCKPLLQRLQSNQPDMPYNFLVSSDGRTYEALGWRRRLSLVWDLTNSSLVLAFIGNFTQNCPTPAQVNGARVFCDESLSRHRLLPNFTIVGRNPVGKTSHLFEPLERLPEWDEQNSS